ncbi:MAG: DUF192 domain-containing protein [Elusimicrobiota bacterium]|jgi:uncharacterized membrane protein (UPF0127 family)|nr:DUF192 domain-containing protein [Elusimicrobiota bacterium]
MKCLNKSNGKVIADKLVLKASLFGRLKGLLGTSGLKEGEGIILKPCAQIHTFFMRYPLDAIFVSKDLKVLSVIENMRPWRLSPFVFKALYTVEVAGGSLKGGVKAGDEVSFVD